MVIKIEIIPIWSIEGHAILDRKVDLRVVLKGIRCIQVIKKISGRTDI